MKITKRIERWFPSPNDPDKSETLIRHLLPGETSDIVNDCTTYKTEYLKNPDTGDLTPVITSQSDPVKIQKEEFKKAVRDWKHFKDENDNAMACTDENKLRAMQEMEGYLEWVRECRGILEEDIKAEKKALEKNS